MNHATEKMIRGNFLMSQTSYGSTVETRLGLTYIDETDNQRPKVVSVKTQAYDPTEEERQALVDELKMLEGPRTHFERGEDDLWHLKPAKPVDEE